MESIGKYAIELTKDSFLTLYKPELTMFPLGKLIVRAQRRGEKELVLLPIHALARMGEELVFNITSNELGVTITGRFNYFSEPDRLECNVEIEARTSTPSFNLVFHLEVEDSGVPRWLVPGVLYKDNRPPGSHHRYPGFSPDKQALEEFLSPYWYFASERTATPCVFGWTDNYSLYIGTKARFDGIESGLFLEGALGKAMLGVCFPWREEPIRHCDFPPEGNQPRVEWLRLHPGDKKNFWFQLSAAPRDLHFYDKIIRYRYFEEREQHPLNPWVGRDEAQSLLGYGLYQWHYDPERHIIAETSVFDRYFAQKKGYFDRENMHVAWISGVPVAYTMLWYGHSSHNDKLIRAGQKVIDRIANNLTPIGTFWGQWSPDKGWTTSWGEIKGYTGKHLNARTLAEATLFMVRALRLELRRGVSHGNWANAIISNIKFCIQAQRADGNFGSAYDPHTGKVVCWEGTAGMLWIAALIAASMHFQVDEFVPPALRAANYYARFIEDELLYGAPEDIGCAPSSEDAYCALISYQLLYQYNRFERWLEFARRAADWGLTFRMSYNCQFPSNTILGKYDFRTRGADIASVVNAHLHNYGLLYLPELRRLAYFMKDNYYSERARDNLECFRQFIAREDGDFGARKGMVSEQYYHTDWRQPKGHLLALSHAWCIGHSLFANLCEEHRDSLP